MINKIINLSDKPVIYNSISAAYESIRNQFHNDYCCRVRRINCGVGAGSALTNTYYIDVFKRDSNSLAGYLGKYNG